MKRKRIQFFTILVILVILGGSFFDYFSETKYSCLECRTELSKRHVFGIPMNRMTTNAYSEEYLIAHRSHQHRWCWSGSTISNSFFTTARGHGRRHPIWSLPPELQAKYATLVSPSELNDSLQIIDSEDRKAAEQRVNHMIENVLDAR